MYVQRVKSGGTQASGRQLSVLQSSGSSKVSLPSREAKSQSAEDSALALDFSKPARNDLEELLRKVRCGHCGSACGHHRSACRALRIRSDASDHTDQLPCPCRASPLCLMSPFWDDAISS